MQRFRQSVALFGLYITLIVVVSGCVSAPTTIQPDWETQSNPIMIVINDPRSERRKRGGNGPGYTARLSYEDDPILHRVTGDIASHYGLSILEQWPLRNLDVHCFVVAQPSPATLRALRADARVRWVQPFNQFSTQSIAEIEAPFVHDSVMQRFAMEVGERGRGIRVAVVDTSADQSHPDFKHSSLVSANFAGQRGRPNSEEHGTAVVGLIAATANSASGLSGLANEAEVRILRACWQVSGSEGQCNTLTLALALDAAIDLKPDILNLSLTGQYDRVLQELLSVLLENGTLVVAAYDERRVAAERFPAPQAGVVYAYGAAGKSLSPKLENVLVAPRQALTLAPMGGYDLASGHSIATPQIVAMAACLMHRHPSADRPEIQAHLARWLTQE